MAVKDDSDNYQDKVSYLENKDPVVFGNGRFYRPMNLKKTNLMDMFEETETEDSNAVKVFLRIKPKNNDETKESNFRMEDDTTLSTKPPKVSVTYKNVTNLSGNLIHKYKFTKVFGPKTPQQNIFNDIVFNQVKSFINGGNSLLFAYGTSSAGKTFTMQGDVKQPGIIPRSIAMIFNSINGRESYSNRYKPNKLNSIVELDAAEQEEEVNYKQKILEWNLEKVGGSDLFQSCMSKMGSTCTSASSDDFVKSHFKDGSEQYIESTFQEMQKVLDSNTRVSVDSFGDVLFSVWVSFAEIYNETIYDLLDVNITKSKRRKILTLAQDSKGVFIKGLRHVCVYSGDEAYQVLLLGQHNMKFAATKLNPNSSRSHCIFCVKLLRHNNTKNPEFAHVSSFMFCDLAGAERLKKTHNMGARLKESQNINTSLHVLGKCITTIRENQTQKEQKLVPFRESKLTRMLQFSLIGSSLMNSVAMIINVSPDPNLYDETINVLKFSAIARNIIMQQAPERKKPPRSSQFVSRFSQFVSSMPSKKPLMESTRADADYSVAESNRRSNCQCEVLLKVAKELKDQLFEERKTNKEKEGKVRNELTSHFSKMLVEIETRWKGRLKDTEENERGLASWRLKKLEDFYENKLKRKRMNDDDDETDSTKSEVSALMEKNTVLRNENAALEVEIKTLRDLLSNSREVQNKSTLENSTLQFEKSSLKKDNIYLTKKVQELNDFIIGSNSNADVKDLQGKIDLLEKENKELNGLLETATDDFKMFEEEKTALESQIENLEMDLAVKSDHLEDLNNQLAATNLLVEEKTELTFQKEKELEFYQTLLSEEREVSFYRNAC